MRRRRNITKSIIIYLVIALVGISVAYAWLSKSLTINGTAQTTASSSQDLTPSGTPQTWQNGSKLQYNFSPITLQNNSSIGYVAWKVLFPVPSDTTGVSCYNATCSYANGVITIHNASYNGTVAAGGSTSFGLSFQTATTGITTSGMTVIGDTGTYNDNQYQTLSGLTTAVSKSSGWQSGNSYIQQYNFTVSNQTGQTLSAWRIKIPWNSSTNSVAAMWNASYVVSGQYLVITSSSALANGSTASFGGQLSVPNQSWQLQQTTQGVLQQ